MKKIYSIALVICGLSAANAQVFDTGNMMQMTDVSNTGVAVGNFAGGAAHVMWTEGSGTATIGESDDQISGMTSISSDAKYVSGSLTNPATGLEEMARYNTTTQVWTFLGTLSPNAGSSAWGMTSDGSTVVGLGDFGGYLGRAVKWSQATGFVDIGTTVAGSSSRANGISDDGSMVVGWQDDDYGDRFGVYWKNGVQTHLTDTNGEFVGEAVNVTPDGKTIVGANLDNIPYIWTETDGYTELLQEDPMIEGTAISVSDDGKTVIGYLREWGTGALSGNGFIWTKETGALDLNEYVLSLGLDDLGITFALPMSISPNGKYITGIGRSDSGYQGFVIKLLGTLGTNNVNAAKIDIYPNPVQNTLYLTNADKIDNVEIYNMVGQKILSTNKVSKEGLNVSNLTKGAYLVKVKTGNQTETVKMLKK
ncbi:T9SS type A sorting domain-containing protein [Kaistella sp.]|uniref:T9SS type A sorting domain-containing protein n=1 Tax=Kaistella sp. TaxID=2782235 RepID=UPI003C657642